MISPPLLGHHSGRATPSLRATPTRAHHIGNRQRLTYPAAKSAQTKPASSLVQNPGRRHLLIRHPTNATFVELSLLLFVIVFQRYHSLRSAAPEAQREHLGSTVGISA